MIRSRPWANADLLLSEGVLECSPESSIGLETVRVEDALDEQGDIDRYVSMLPEVGLVLVYPDIRLSVGSPIISEVGSGEEVFHRDDFTPVTQTVFSLLPSDKGHDRLFVHDDVPPFNFQRAKRFLVLSFLRTFLASSIPLSEVAGE